MGRHIAIIIILSLCYRNKNQGLWDLIDLYETVQAVMIIQYQIDLEMLSFRKCHSVIEVHSIFADMCHQNISHRKPFTTMPMSLQL